MKCHNTLLGGSCAFDGFKCGIFYCKKSSRSEEKQIAAGASEYDKRRLRANRDALRLLALRPRLLDGMNKKVDKISSQMRSTNRKSNFALSSFVRSMATRNGNVITSLVTLIFIFAFSLILQNSYVSEINAASLTLTVPSAPLSLNLTPSAESNFAKSTAGQVSVLTDNITGYTLSIKSGGEEDDGDTNAKLKNTLNSSFINSISESTSEEKFKTDSKFNNTWGYLPSKFGGSSNSDFLPAPTTKSSMIEKTEAANSGAANNYDVTIATKVDQSIPAGNYQNAFIFSATVNEIPAEPMQNWEGCSGLSEHETVRLRDIRDDTIYTVAKLKDGKCWMVENMKIINKTITSSDSDMSSGSYTIPSSNISAFNVGSSGWSSNPNNQAAYIDSTYGGYYTWQVATAGSGSSYTSSGQTAPNSICPKGWKLPTGNSSSSDYGKLVEAYGGNNSTGSSNLRATPVPGFTYAGYVDYSSGSLLSQGSLGNYWSSTVFNSTIAYVLNLDSSYADPADSYYRVGGPSVRCVDNQRTYSITYNLNSGENGPEPNPQTGGTWDPSIKLSSTTPSREGYNFKGWCDKETSDENCSGTTYQPGADLPLQSGSNAITLWAMWQKSSCPNTVTDCSVGSYSGKRFGNGKCWMSSDFKTDVQWSANFGCPSGWSTPTYDDFNSLISPSQAGSGSCLYEQGWSGNYWSSTQLNVYNYYYVLGVLSSSAPIGNDINTSYYGVRCVSS